MLTVSKADSPCAQKLHAGVGIFLFKRQLPRRLFTASAKMEPPIVDDFGWTLRRLDDCYLCTASPTNDIDHYRNAIDLRAGKPIEILPSDIIIASYPRSGTTWLKSILLALYSPNATEQLQTGDIHQLIPSLDDRAKDETLQLQGSPPRRIYHTHYPLRLLPLTGQQRPKIIYIARTVHDVVVSNYHFRRGCRIGMTAPFQASLDDYVKQFIHGRVWYAPFSQHCIDAWKASNVLFLTYERLSENAAREIERIAEFLHVREYDAGEIASMCHFDKMKRNRTVQQKENAEWNSEEAFVRRGVVGGWQDEMSDEQAERLSAYIRTSVDDVELQALLIGSKSSGL